jgi:hypothetical protein
MAWLRRIYFFRRLGSGWISREGNAIPTLMLMLMLMLMLTQRPCTKLCIIGEPPLFLDIVTHWQHRHKIILILEKETLSEGVMIRSQYEGTLNHFADFDIVS